MKKRILAGMVVLCMLAALTGCGSASSYERLKEASKLVTLGEYTGLELTVAEVTEEEIDEYVTKNLLEANSTYEQIKEGIVKEGDTANISFEGKVDGAVFDGGSNMDDPNGYDLTIGSNSFIDGFEEGLIGVSVGETVDLNLTFPENYTEELAGQAVVFTVTVNYIRGEQVIPELSDEFVKSNTEYDNVTNYKNFAKETLMEQKETEAENNLWITAVNNATISEYPENDMNDAIESLRNYYTSLAYMYNLTFEDFLTQIGSSEADFNEEMRPYAEQSVASILVALTIANKEKLKLTDKVYEEKLQEYLKNSGYSTVEELKENVDENKITEQIYIDLARKFVNDKAVKK